MPQPVRSAMAWPKAWLLASTLAIAGLGVHETLVSYANHRPSIVSDADLFCTLYNQLHQLEETDIVLLGASRMQTGVDLEVLQRRYPHRKALMLAQSGQGTSYPVFQDIVDNTSFRGTIIIDETEHTLASQSVDQQGTIDHCRTQFSIDSALNRRLASWLQSRLMFLNPQSSAIRLWGNLVVENELPEPFYTRTLADRQQLVEYERAAVDSLNDLYEQRLQGVRQQAHQGYLPPEQWLHQTQHWQRLIHTFQQRGGRVIFVRMPVAWDRWMLEREVTPLKQYWQPFMEKTGVASLHFAEAPELTRFDFPDSSHLDEGDRANFTDLLLQRLESELRSR